MTEKSGFNKIQLMIFVAIFAIMADMVLMGFVKPKELNRRLDPILYEVKIPSGGGFEHWVYLGNHAWRSTNKSYPVWVSDQRGFSDTTPDPKVMPAWIRNRGPVVYKTRVQNEYRLDHVEYWAYFGKGHWAEVNFGTYNKCRREELLPA